MPVLDSQHIQQEIDDTQIKINKLQRAYDHFLATWKDIEKKEQETLQALHKDIDKLKLAEVLKDIDTNH
ncbi:hypothetical protein KKG22_02085 [Patescibacteria group bacterium]|nr:hypothetical protein [Patescibacteria group bacterium]MBU1721858.1 hypothetical protein [Patescibacteria group bacterium]MBU1901316.1 hypothetical protein [Patescibacteria group bacterium]